MALAVAAGVGRVVVWGVAPRGSLVPLDVRAKGVGASLRLMTEDGGGAREVEGVWERAEGV